MDNMGKLAVVAVVVMMLVLTEAKEPLSSDKASVEKVARNFRSISKLAMDAAAIKRSTKRDTCVGFSEKCGGFFGDSCCSGLECVSDNNDLFSDGTCWLAM